MNTDKTPTHADEVGGGTSASNAQADLLCEGRHQAQRGLADISTTDSQFGTRVHAALANDDPSKLDPDQLSIYEGCVDIRARLISDTFGSDATQAVRLKEKRLWYKSKDESLIHSGKPDLNVRHGSKGLILEYKSLPADVPGVASNLQLRDQVALAAGYMMLDEVVVYIVQPLVTYSPVPCPYYSSDIKKAQSEMVSRITRSHDPEAKRTAGAVQCKFCLARFTCKEYANWTAVSVPVAMSSLTVPVAEWTPEQRSLFCERLPAAMKWLEECKNQMKAMIAKEPASVPGWTLEEGNTRHSINNPNELHSRFLAAGGTTEQFMACVDIRKGNLEAQVRIATGLKGKGLASKLKELLDGITDEKKNEPSLALAK